MKTGKAAERQLDMSAALQSPCEGEGCEALSITGLCPDYQGAADDADWRKDQAAYTEASA